MFGVIFEGLFIGFVTREPNPNSANILCPTGTSQGGAGEIRLSPVNRGNVIFHYFNATPYTVELTQGKILEIVISRFNPRIVLIFLHRIFDCFIFLDNHLEGNESIMK